MFSAILNYRNILLTILISLTGFACVSRYRLDLNLILEENVLKAKVNKAAYFEDMKFGDIYSDSKLVAGDGYCVVLTTVSRGKTVVAEGKNRNFISIDENIRYKLYLQLPAYSEVKQISLEYNSFVQLLGKYEIPVEDKIYTAADGTLLIDSIVDSEILFGTIDGMYSNRLDQEVAYRGKFKVKLAN